ncbi:hypothetical protein FA95DRAFT_1096269 [Auriscalpium vulgare]|uniref:Uncharacterized protein n=1 Tax=Auriscalpium vulgare TaxID=40419 RepID=A0ACB8RWC3_9AGAM|nr:hypothetical protein FA95DRAFT_1096269 [Auriscalpium vulgare]
MTYCLASLLIGYFAVKPTCLQNTYASSCPFSSAPSTLLSAEFLPCRRCNTQIGEKLIRPATVPALHLPPISAIRCLRHFLEKTEAVAGWACFEFDSTRPRLESSGPESPRPSIAASLSLVPDRRHPIQ